MTFRELRNIFLPKDKVQVQDHREENRSIWTIETLFKLCPELIINYISKNEIGLVFYTDDEMSIMLHDRNKTS